MESMQYVEVRKNRRPSIVYEVCEEEQMDGVHEAVDFKKVQSSVSAMNVRNESPYSSVPPDDQNLTSVEKEEKERQNYHLQKEGKKEEVEHKKQKDEQNQIDCSKNGEEDRKGLKKITNRKLAIERRQQQQKKQREKMKIRRMGEKEIEKKRQQQQKNIEEDQNAKQKQRKPHHQPKANPTKNEEQTTGWSFCNNSNAFADSPYFNAFVEKELNSLKLNADIMKEIACKSSNFSNAGKAMAKAARELSMSCRFIKSEEYNYVNDNTATSTTSTTSIDKEELSMRVKSVGIKSATILKHFATVLEDIATAQEKIATAVEASLGSHLAENAMSQVKRAKVYKDEARKQTEEAENNLSDYMNNKYGETITALNDNKVPASYSSYFSSSSTKTALVTSSSLSSTANSSKYSNKDRIGMMSRTPSSRSIVMNSNTHTYRGSVANTPSDQPPSRASMMIKSLSVRGDMMSGSPTNKRTSSIRRGRMMNKSQSIRNIENNVQTAPPSSLLGSLQKTMSFRWTVDNEEKNDAMPSIDDSSIEGLTNLSPFATTNDEDYCSGCNRTTSEVEKQQKSDDLLNNKAIKMANLKYNLEQIRVDQATAQLRRFRLSGLFVEASYKQDIKLSQNTYKLMNEMQSYYKCCFDGLVKILPRTKKLAKDVVRTQQTNIKGWKESEKKIVEVVDNFKSHAMEAYEEVEAVEEEVSTRTFNSSGGCYTCNNMRNNKNNDVFIDPNMLTQEVLLLKENCRLWSSLPMALTTTASYPRIKPPGVVVEGWVYENIKSPGMMMMTTKSEWVRNWFMLKDDGILYSLQSKPEWTTDYQCCTYKGKVCNIVLCAVQQQQQNHLLQQDLTNSNHSTNFGAGSNNFVKIDCNFDQRFCFKLMTPHRKDPITIKTIGPHDLHMWLDGIKSTIMKQLSKGRAREDKGGSKEIGASISSYSTEIMNNERQLSSEVEDTFLDIRLPSLYINKTSKEKKGKEKESENNSNNNTTTNRSSQDNNKNDSSNTTVTTTISNAAINTGKTSPDELPSGNKIINSPLHDDGEKNIATTGIANAAANATTTSSVESTTSSINSKPLNDGEKNIATTDNTDIANNEDADTNDTMTSSSESPNSSLSSTPSYDGGEEIDDDISDILTSIESLYIPKRSRDRKK